MTANEFEFEYDLTEREKEAARGLYQYLFDAYGRENAKTRKKLQAFLADYKGGNFTMNDGAIRKIIRWIRINGYMPDLIAGQPGYYRTKNKAELKKFIYKMRSKAKAELYLARQIR